MDVEARIRAVMEAHADAVRATPVGPTHRQAVEAMRVCTGKVICTGMGKAGHVARKFAATLCSTGQPAAFLHPGEAAHGDLGLIGKGDIVFAFSNSGRTAEVLAVVERARPLGAALVVGITSHPDGPLRDMVDLLIDLGPIAEPCRLGLTPTASVGVMLAVSDGLALALMDLRGFSRADFGARHHGGYLGQQTRQGT
jgi:arabinose-5-phosphate isomerase